MATQRKPKTVLEVRGYAFGRESFPAEHFGTVNKAIAFMAAAFGSHRGLVCFFESGVLDPDGTFTRHEDGICMRMTEAPRTSVAAAA